MAENPNNNIEKALSSLTDALEIEPTGEEIYTRHSCGYL